MDLEVVVDAVKVATGRRIVLKCGQKEKKYHCSAYCDVSAEYVADIRAYNIKK